MTTVLGIDPGALGGFAWNEKDKGVRSCSMPRDQYAVVELIRSIVEANQGNRIVAYIEMVTGYIKPVDKGEEERENRQPAHQMFKFGRGVGLLTGALVMAGIEIHEVSPRTWQKPYYVNLATPGAARKSRSERKRVLHDIAQRRFPQIQVTLKIADALLIHAFGVAMEGETLPGLEASEKPHVPLPFSHGYGPQFEGMKRACVPVDGKRLFIAEYRGKECVFQHGRHGAIYLHEADSHDLDLLPRGPDAP